MAAVTESQRWLGLDIGERTIGLSLSDPFGWTAQGIGVIRRRSREYDLAALRQVVAKHGVTGLVVGLPRNMDGTEGESAAAVRVTGDWLATELGLPVHYWDERLSTRAAERTLLEADLSRSRRRQLVDQQAAVFILQGFLQRQETSRERRRET